MDKLGFHLPSLIAYFVNFTLLMVLLYLFAYKKVLKMIDDRSAKIRESLEAAEKAQEAAAKSQEDLRKQMDDARRESQGLIDEARRVSERIRAEEQAKVQTELLAIRERALADIERERDAAIEEVRKHFAELAITAAERVIQQDIDQTRHRTLIEQVLKEAESVGAQRKG